MMQTQIQKAINAHNAGKPLIDACLAFGVAVSTVKYHMRKAKGGAVGNTTAHISVPGLFSAHLRKLYPDTCLNRAIEMHLESQNPKAWAGPK